MVTAPTARDTDVILAGRRESRRRRESTAPDPLPRGAHPHAKARAAIVPEGTRLATPSPPTSTHSIPRAWVGLAYSARLRHRHRALPELRRRAQDRHRDRDPDEIGQIPMHLGLPRVRAATHPGVAAASSLRQPDPRKNSGSASGCAPRRPRPPGQPAATKRPAGP